MQMVAVIYAQMTLATCSRRNFALSPQVLPPDNVSGPSEEYISPFLTPALRLASSSSVLASVCPDPLLMRRMEPHSVRTPRCVPTASPQAFQTTCFPGDEQGWVWMEVWSCDMLYLRPKAATLVLTKSHSSSLSTFCPVQFQSEGPIGSSRCMTLGKLNKPPGTFIFSSVILDDKVPISD